MGGKRRSRSPHREVPLVFKARSYPVRFTFHWKRDQCCTWIAELMRLCWELRLPFPRSRRWDSNPQGAALRKRCSTV
jgi:hypothetical protein